MIKLSDKVIFREIDGKGVLIDLDSGFYYSMNEVGCLIFNLIQEKRAPDRIREEIEMRFEVTPVEAEKDLEEFLGALEKEGIVISRG